MERVYASVYADDGGREMERVYADDGGREMDGEEEKEEEV